MDQSEIDRQITLFVAEALMGAFGPIPVARVMRRYLRLFSTLREIGVPWDAIARRFASHGLQKDPAWWRVTYSKAMSATRDKTPKPHRPGGEAQRDTKPAAPASPVQLPPPAEPAPVAPRRPSLKDLLPPDDPSRQPSTIITIGKKE
jgi:hypothetical protein